MSHVHRSKTASGLRALLPDAARHYLAHTADGRPLRDIAREVGCHPSTILRPVRKLESQRDDPLVDRVLSESSVGSTRPEGPEPGIGALADALRGLCQTGALLVYRDGVDQAAIVQTAGEGDTRVLGVVDLDIAAALALRDWIAPDGGTSIKRYRITEDGRGAVVKLVAERDAQAAQTDDTPSSVLFMNSTVRRTRYRSGTHGPGSDNPLAALARRRDSDGTPFLPARFVKAGERLHEDFAIAGFSDQALLGWDSPDALQPLYARAETLADRGRSEAMCRTLDAVRDLGPGLSEVVLRCCCLQEGLEATEKRLGWSARSGKIVLRIALQRLSLFYAKARAKEPVLVG